MSKPVKIVVVGGSGFIGRHFVARAVAQGHEVTVFNRSPFSGPREGVRDIHSGGLERLVSRFEDFADVDVICHFASSTVPASSNADPERDIQENLVQAVKLLGAMRQAAEPRLVYLSSGGAIYGTPQYSPIDEAHPQNPISSYGIVKGAVERYIGMHAASHGLSAAIVRPANPYGPGQDPAGQVGAVPVFLKAAADRKPIKVFGDGSTVRDFVYIDDLIDLLMHIVENRVTGVYNCGGGGGGASLSDLQRIIEMVVGRELEVERLPARPFDPPVVVLDNGRAEALGWRASVSLEDGVARTWRAMHHAQGAV